MPRKIFSVVALLAALGLLDASYLTYKYYKGGSVVCAVLNGCDVVFSSAYASILGVPVALLGAVFYFSLLVLALSDLFGFGRYEKALRALAAGGFLASIYFLFLQAFVIRAWCFYCLISAGLTIIIFTFSLLLASTRGKNLQERT